MDLQEAFESAGFATTACEVLASARNALAKQTFSLIVLDVMLPDGDGIELLREIKSTPGIAATPVILLSTEGEVHERVRGLKTGADDYVGKPYDAALVVARARQLVGDLQHHRDAQSGRSLLLIDDSATFRNEFKSVLENAGYQVLTAETGEDGLRTAVAIRPLAIIVDGVLPGGMDGVQAAGVIKEQWGTPVIYLTAFSDVHTLERANATGPFGYLVKPFFKDSELRCAIEVAVNRHRTQELSRERERLLVTTLRTPLYGIIRLVDRLAQTELTSQQEEYLRMLRFSSEELLVLLNDTLDPSTGEGGN
jgi:DNA-binding response OmpR family regulator